MSNYNVILCRACGAEVDFETWQCPYCPPGTPTTATDPVAGVDELVARAKPGIPDGQAPLAADPALAVSDDLAELLDQPADDDAPADEIPPEPEVVSIDDDEAAVLVSGPAPPPGLPLAPPLPIAPPPAAPGLPPGVPLAPVPSLAAPISPLAPPALAPGLPPVVPVAPPPAELAFADDELVEEDAVEEGTEILDVLEDEPEAPPEAALAFEEAPPPVPAVEAPPPPPTTMAALAFEEDEPAFHVPAAPAPPAAPPRAPAPIEVEDDSLAALFGASSAPLAPAPAPPPSKGRSRACPTCGTRLSASGACLICGSDPSEPAAAAPAPDRVESPRLVPEPRRPEALSFVDEPPAPASAPASLPPMRSPLAAPASLPPMRSPFAATPAAPASLPPMASPLADPAASESDRAFGLLLFEAEESLGRGQPETAVALASRAVAERPESLVARSLQDRSRRELTRGRRRERLEIRLDEAEQRLEAGDLAAAETIVCSALRLMPDHQLALSLFTRLRQQRLQADTTEAAAGRELEHSAQAQGERAAERAAKAMRAGNWRQALLIVRHGLRAHPADARLLALHAEAFTALERQQAERARSRAQAAQVRAAQARIGRGVPAEAVPLLEAVLAEDPDSARAWSALDDARRALAPRPAEATPPAAPLQLEEPPPTQIANDPAEMANVSAEVADVFVRGGAELMLEDGGPEAPAPPAPAPPVPAPRPASGPQIPPKPAPEPVRPPRRPTPREPIPAIGREPLPVVRRPPPSRNAGLLPVLVIGALIVGGLAWVTLRGEPEMEGRQPTVITPRTRIAPPPSTLGPLVQVDPALRAAVESALEAYARAFQVRDAGLLEKARPDLPEAERRALLGLYTDAVSFRMELRVLDVTPRPDGADVTVLRTDVAVGGSARPGPPGEETWRFVQKDGVWGLRPAR